MLTEEKKHLTELQTQLAEWKKLQKFFGDSNPLGERAKELVEKVKEEIEDLAQEVK
jgi:predicted transcriptional regulator